jgi:hypothetical protein
VLKSINLIERAELVSGEMCVTVCIAVRGIQRGRMMLGQTEECDKQRGKTSKVRRICTRKDTGTMISKIANRIKVFIFYVLNVCKREYGI